MQAFPFRILRIISIAITVPLSVLINGFLPQIPYLMGRNHVHQELPSRSKTAVLDFSIFGIVALQHHKLLMSPLDATDKESVSILFAVALKQHNLYLLKFFTL
jgi:hypothetical protein